MIRRQKISQRCTGMVLMDIEKSVDSKRHDGIIFKKHEFKIPIYIMQQPSPQKATV